MDFQEYIEAKGLLEINVIIRDNSTISLDKALDIVRNRVNRNADLYQDIDIKAKMTDFRNGNIYEVFSDRWLDKYDQTSWWNLQLDNVSIQKMLNQDSSSNNDCLDCLQGFSKEVLITSEDGTAHIEVDNPNQKSFNVFLKIEDEYMIYAKLENEKLDGFDIVLYDESTFENKKLNCSEKNVKVNYVVIYE
jgi:hypothetical protein